MKVFISYDHSEDRHYKELLRAWDANSDFEFEFDVRSPNVAINSTDASVIKSTLTRMMKQADYLLVIIGEKSHESKWMRWEIETAKQADIKLKLAAVKIENSYNTPEGLLGAGASFARSFKEQEILNALWDANNNY
ncbi:MAG: TIR-like protein [Bacteroidota bacterium]|nr:TIR-like protein [Bacteroidota bacterium]